MDQTRNNPTTPATRRARLNICSSKTSQPIANFTINGIQAQNGSEVEIRNCEQMEFTLAANGFYPCTVRTTLSELAKTNFLLTAYLDPKDETVRMVATCDDGKKVEGFVRITADDKLYPYLHDMGSYHVLFTKQKPVTSIPDKDNKGNSSWLKMLLCALGGIIAGFLLAHLLSPGNDETKVKEKAATTQKAIPEDNAENMVSPAEESSLPTSTIGEVPAEVDIIDVDTETNYEKNPGSDDDNVYPDDTDDLGPDDPEKRDLEYLKVKNTWVEAELQSETYQEFFGLIMEGNLEALIQHEYTSGTPINGYWLKIADNIKSMKGNSNKLQQCRSEMIRLSKRGKCNLQELNSAVSMIANKH